jgi:hypothetical protein
VHHTWSPILWLEGAICLGIKRTFSVKLIAYLYLALMLRMNRSLARPFSELKTLLLVYIRSRILLKTTELQELMSPAAITVEIY